MAPSSGGEAQTSSPSSWTSNLRKNCNKSPQNLVAPSRYILSNWEIRCKHVKSYILIEGFNNNQCNSFFLTIYISVALCKEKFQN